MMRYIAFLAIVGSLIASTTLEARQKMDYKCYLETSNGFEIGMHSWNVKQLKVQMAKLIGKPNHNKKKVRSFIKNVEECVLVQESFSSSAAKKLDDMTLK